jgi:sodium/potassium-transporting ATPase subunit alpha
MFSTFQVRVEFFNGVRPAQRIAPQSNNDDDETEKFDLDASGMRETVDVSGLNSRIKFDRADVPFEQRNILGDATETGLTRFAARFLPTNYDEYVKNHPKAFESQ